MEWLPIYYLTNFKFNIDETSEAEGIADHVTLLRLLLFCFHIFLYKIFAHDGKANPFAHWGHGVIFVRSSAFWISARPLLRSCQAFPGLLALLIASEDPVRHPEALLRPSEALSEDYGRTDVQTDLQTDGWTYGRTDLRKLPSVSYRISSPLGPLPMKSH